MAVESEPGLKTLQAQLNRINRAIQSFCRSRRGSGDRTWIPPVDLAETQDKIVVRAEVPGVGQEDINIEFANGILTLRGERKIEKNGDGVTYHRVERTYGNFIRSFNLPRAVDPERISASYGDVILEIEVAKKEGGEAEADPNRR